MSVKIGHASIDESGKTKGGKAGDQTGKEVCIRDWYNKGWNVVLRPKSKTTAEKSAKACEAGCANSNIGYDQNQRNTLHTQAKAKGYDLAKVGACETDCSAFMTVCAIAGGVKELEYTGNAPTTATMRKAFSATGKYTVLTASKYLTSDAYLERGDILVKEGSHTVMVLSNGSKVSQKNITSLPNKETTIKYTVTAKSGLYIRKEPNGIASKLVAMPYGSTFIGDGQVSSGWVHGTWGNKTGWSFGNYLKRI